MTRSDPSDDLSRRLSPASRAALLVAVLLTLAVYVSHHRLHAVLELESGPRTAQVDAYLLPAPAALSVMSLGHQEMMADLVWLQALSYFAVQFYLDKDYRWLDRYVETVIELDPRFRMIYQWAGVVVMYGGQIIDNEAVMTSNRFLEMGRQQYPDDWLLNFMLGCNYRYELRPETPEQERDWRLLGATYLRGAAEQPDAPSWLALTALRTLDRYGAADEATSVGLQAFLDQTGQLSATLRAELQLHAHNPTLRYSPDLDLSSLVGNGLRLRSRLPSVDWWRALDYRRRLFADTDTESGYLPLDLRLLLRGEPSTRTRAGSTPLDAAFGASLRLLLLTEENP